MAAPQPIFIDFEGIDGSGKTSLSNRLADYLREHGVPVQHAREKGVFRSKISRAIRELTRDPSFLRMTNFTELLLYVARDAQMIDEYIRPKLKAGQVVFSDRYLYSAITHSHHARGIDRKVVDSILEHAAGGLWPDLVVYCDVDPLTSRVRKKIQKVRDHRLSDFGRKGLMGIGFREEMRNGFLELAKEQPETWLVIDNARSSIEESLQRIFNRVKDVLARKGYPEVPDPKWADLEKAADPQERASPLSRRVDALLAISDVRERVEKSPPEFFEHLRSLIPDQAAFAGLYVSGFNVLEAHEIRERLIDLEPAIVAYGLRGMRSEPSMNFRERLLESEPIYVARSLSGMSSHPRAMAMREQLADIVPEQVALALKGNDTEAAWALRERLRRVARKEVLLSLRGIDTEPAWKIREKRAKNREFSPAFLESIAGIDTDRAWEWREKLAEEFLPWVLVSLRGLRSDRSWEWRERYVHCAPKFIIRSIGTSNDPRAWKLRQDAKLFAKEVLDSLSGIDSADAWSLRTELRDKWPNTAVSSLGAGNQSERAWKFRWEQLERYPENVLLFKHIAKAAYRSLGEFFEAPEDDDDRDDEVESDL